MLLNFLMVNKKPGSNEPGFSIIFLGKSYNPKAVFT
jgi:hypothetical protein